MKGNKKALLAVAITLLLQLGTRASYAEGIVGSNVTVDTSRGVPIVQIQPPNQGVSHNTYHEFHTNTGVIFNNAIQPEETHLAGRIIANPNLQQPANIIVNEVIGSSPSTLAGTIEVAGHTADVVIANPNGIMVNQLHFMNTDRAVLTTGVPHMDKGRLEGFTVRKGNIVINKDLNAPIVAGDAVQYDAINKVDLFAKAVHVNADIFAKDKIQVITGNNFISYRNHEVTPLDMDERMASGVSLDVAALGGMYANTITLIGTETGLGVNLAGTLNALTGDLHIDTAGNLTITQQRRADENSHDEESTHVYAAKNIDIRSQNFINRGHVIAEENVHMHSANIANEGILQAKNIAIHGKKVAGKGVISADNDVEIYADNNIVYEGGIRSALGQVSLLAKTVQIDKENVSALSKDKIHIIESEPSSTLDTTKEEIPKKKTLDSPETSKLHKLDNTPAKTVIVTGADVLPITVDMMANKSYQAIIDKARNGVDLVMIAPVDGQGISLNKYIDFNVKTKGLVLNNATSYAKTTLAGYVDKNMFLAGHGARTIINEVTSTNPSALHGYIEVAGNPADVVIVNPNGMAVNGLGFINSKNVALRTLQHMNIVGRGFNGLSADTISIHSNQFYNDASEVWGKHLDVHVSDSLINTGNIGAENLHIQAKSIRNTGFVESKGYISMTVQMMEQDRGTVKAGSTLTLDAQSFNNKNHAVLETNKDLLLKGHSLENIASSIVSNGDMLVAVKNIKNQDGGSIVSKGDVAIQGHSLVNAGSSIITQGKSTFVLENTLDNRDGGRIWSQGDSILQVADMYNRNATLSLDGLTTLSFSNFLNHKNGYVALGDVATLQGVNFNNANAILRGMKDLRMHVSKDFHNADSIMRVDGNFHVEADTIQNVNTPGDYYGATLSVGRDAHLIARASLLNRSSDIIAKGDIEIQAPSIHNYKERFNTDWQVTEEEKYETIPHLDQPNYYEADRRYHRTIHTGKIVEETASARILAEGNIRIQGTDISNRYSQIMAGNDMTLTATRLENTGYQGTIHYDDIGRDRHYWKRKKKKRFLGIRVGSKWVYGHTDIPYENHQVFDEKISPTSERVAVLSSHGKTKIQADTFINQTVEADGSAYALREKAVDTTFAPLAVPNMQAVDDTVLSQILGHTKKLYLENAPLATFFTENHPEYTDKKKFLSSDYMLSRIQADPEHVYRRLSRGYEEQILVKEQLRQLTNREKWGIANKKELFKQWMDNGILLPKVYVSRLHAEDLRRDGSIVLGNDVHIVTNRLENIGTIAGSGALSIQGKEISNVGGHMQGQNVWLQADSLKNISGDIAADTHVTIQAKDVLNETKKTAIIAENYQKDVVRPTAAIRSVGAITLHADTIRNVAGIITAGKDLDIRSNQLDIAALSAKHHVATIGAKLEETHHLGSVLQGDAVHIQSSKIDSRASHILGNTISITADELRLDNAKDYAFSDVVVGRLGSHYFNRKLTAHEKNMASTMVANQDIQLAIGNTLKVKGSTIHSNEGNTSIQAGDVVIINDTERHEVLTAFHEKDRGLLSVATTDIYHHQKTEGIIGSIISSKDIHVDSRGDIEVKSSDIVADRNVNLHAKGNLDVLSEVAISTSQHTEQVKKSGLFSNGGFGIMIGSQRQKDTYDATQAVEKGSTIGSIQGNVFLQAQGEALIKASDVLAKGDITLNGKKIDIVNGWTTETNNESHDFTKSGITLSLSNQLLHTAAGISTTLQQSKAASDERLQSLLTYKAYDDAKKSLRKNSLETQAKSLHLDVSLGREKYMSHEAQDKKTVNPSHLVADGDIHVATTKEDIRIVGSQILGDNTRIHSAKDVILQGGENISKTTSVQASRAASVGVSYDVLKHHLSDIHVHASGSKGNSMSEDITYEEVVIQAKQGADIVSQKDMHITDGKIKGDSVAVRAGGNLHITSLQDRHSYQENAVSGGLGMSLGKNGGFSSSSGSLNTKDIDSEYASVTRQAGIYAGSQGFTVTTGDTTKLVGAVLASDTDKNLLKTKNLVMEDIENKARYSYASKGLSYLNDKTINQYSDNYNDKGVLPSISPEEQANSVSKTYSAVAKGRLDITSKDVDIYDIRRDTVTSLNRLSKIFDKQSIEERQEIAYLFSKYANEAIHRFGERRNEKGEKTYSDGSAEKIALHALTGLITQKITKGNIVHGALVGGMNEALIENITKLAQDNPEAAQILSAGLGYVVDKLVGGVGDSGISIAQAGTKWNRYGPRRYFDGEVVLQLTEQMKYKVKKKEDIDFSDILEGKLLILEQGKEASINLKDVPNGYIIWVEDQDSLGQDYRVDIQAKKLIPVDGNFSSLSLGIKSKNDIIYHEADNLLWEELHLKYTNEKGVSLSEIMQDKKGRDLMDGFKEGFKSALVNDIEAIITLLTDPVGVAEDMGYLIYQLMSNPSSLKIRERLIDFRNEVLALAFSNDYRKKGKVLGQTAEILFTTLVGVDEAKALSKTKYFRELAKIQPKVSVELKEVTVMSSKKSLAGIGDIEAATVKIPTKLNIELNVKKSVQEIEKSEYTKLKHTNKGNVNQHMTVWEGNSGLSGAPSIYKNGEQYKIGTKELKKNIVYESKGYYYKTDNLGRIDQCEASLRLEEGVRNSKDQLLAGGIDRLPNDHGGHLIAKIFGGSGSLDNVVAMDKIVNTSKYKILENEWKSALQAGKSVDVKIDVVYQGNSKRPQKFSIKYWIDGKEYRKNISNGG